MRYVLQVMTIREPGFYEFPGVGPVMLDQAGIYALTQSEIAGPFADVQEARRLTAMVARRPLKPSRDKPPPYREADQDRGDLAGRGRRPELSTGMPVKTLKGKSCEATRASAMGHQRAGIARSRLLEPAGAPVRASSTCSLSSQAESEGG